MQPIAGNAEAQPIQSSKRILEPHERIAEVLFGLIMVLTFTGSLSAADAGKSEIRTMLLGALGCNLAWGFIDAVFYLMGCLAEKGRSLVALRAARAVADPPRARQLIREFLPAPIGTVLEPAELDAIHARLKALPEPPERAHLDAGDYQGGAGVFLLVFLSTFPVVIPFMLMDDARIALRVSNLVAIGLLFLAGNALGRYAGLRPLKMGVAMVLLGVVLVAVTMLLGG